ncbi:response regulator [Nitrososphaera sp.]|uniref:response regulator n=1 Tax=Nitrososphaera sp. TaxID=1971748 RepID=UPI00307F5AF0
MKMNILVAEDEPSMSELYRIVLTARGHTVTITADGEECIKAYKSATERLPGKIPSRYEPFDVVVLDYRMPKMDGLEAARQILAMNPQQRIIFASAFVRETLRDSVKQLDQVVELIQKPFEPKVLVDLIEDTSILKELQEINKMVAEMNGSKSDEVQIDELLSILKRIQKVGF